MARQTDKSSTFTILALLLVDEFRSDSFLLLFAFGMSGLVVSLSYWYLGVRANAILLNAQIDTCAAARCSGNLAGRYEACT